MPELKLHDKAYQASCTRGVNFVLISPILASLPDADVTLRDGFAFLGLKAPATLWP